MLLALLILCCAAHDTIDLRLQLLQLEALPLARQLSRLQHYLTQQRDVPGADSGKLQLMLQLIELHRASSRREPLQRLWQLVRSHATGMRGLVRQVLAAEPGELSESAPEQALFQVEWDWELHSYATGTERRRLRRLLREFRAHALWSAEKRRRLDAVLVLVRRLDGTRRLMRLFEARAATLSETQMDAVLARIEALSGEGALLMALSPYRRSRSPLVQQELHALWMAERAEALGGDRF